MGGIGRGRGGADDMSHKHAWGGVAGRGTAYNTTVRYTTSQHLVLYFSRANFNRRISREEKKSLTALDTIPPNTEHIKTYCTLLRKLHSLEETSTKRY